MFPIRDVNPTRITPWLTVIFVVASVVVFFFLQGQGTEAEQREFLYRYAAVSCEILTGDPLSLEEISSGDCDQGAGPPIFPEKNPAISVLVSMFLHGGFAHLFFNMWSLWIFGNNVEEAFGHLGYAFLYLVGGVVATLAFALVNPGSTTPLLGASGAIAAVLGAYAVLFPTHRILTLVGWFVLPLPAIMFLAVWFFGQFGLGGTNVAWEAHVGGFVFGVFLALVFRGRLLRRVRLAWVGG